MLASLRLNMALGSSYCPRAGYRRYSGDGWALRAGRLGADLGVLKGEGVVCVCALFPVGSTSAAERVCAGEHKQKGELCGDTLV